MEKEKIFLKNNCIYNNWRRNILYPISNFCEKTEKTSPKNVKNA